MSRRGMLGIGVMALLAAYLLGGCAPGTSPATPAVSAPKSATTATAQPPVPQVSPEDAAWQQTIRLAQKEGRLIVYDTIFFAGDMGRIVSKAFKDTYGISVEFVVMGGSSVTLEKLKVERSMGQAVADMVGAGSVSSKTMIGLGIMKPLARDLPALRDKSVFVMDPVYSPGGEAISFVLDYVGTAVNSNLVKSGEIQSHNDLLDPKWKGKIAMRDPRLGSGGEPLSVTTFRYAKALDDDFFYKLAAQKPALLAIGYTEVAQMVARGEYAICWACSADSAVAPVVKQGGPLTVLPLKEGIVAQSSVLMILDNANHPNAARLFLNWILSSEGQRAYNEAKGASSFRKDVPDFSPPQLAGARLAKPIPVTWEIADQVNTEVKAGVMDKFFGKR